MTIQVKTPGVRRTPSGSYELTLSHRLIPGGRAMRNFPSEAEAAAYKIRMLAHLNDDVLPVELTRAGVKSTTRMGPAIKRKTIARIPIATTKIGSQSPLIRDVLQAYLDAGSAKIAKSDRPSVLTLQDEIEGRLDGIRTDWLDAWIRHMKRERRLAPGTIRKKVESLARAIDWWNRQQHQTGGAPPNILRLLPVGYSAYQDGDVPDGEEVRVDRKRDRRLHPGEYEKIVAVLQGEKPQGKQRPWAGEDAADFLMLFRLIVHTGLRLREAYSLHWDDVKPHLRTIHVRPGKTGVARDVPTTRQVEEWLATHKESRQGKRLVFPFWSGVNDEKVLERVSGALSRRFSTLFKYCGLDDLVEHDLRHHATCLWMEKRDAQGRWMFRPEEVRRITGHQNVQIFERYLSMRGSDLAERLD